MNKIATITTKKTITLKKIFDDFEGNFLFLSLCLINYIWTNYQSHEMNKSKYPNYCMDNHECYELIDIFKDGFVFSQWINIGFICLNILWIIIGSGIIKYIPKYLYELTNSKNKNFLLLCIGLIYINITKFGILSLGLPYDYEFESTKFPQGISNLKFIRKLYFAITISTMFLLILFAFILIISYIYNKSPSSINELNSKITNKISKIINAIKIFYSKNYNIIHNFLWILLYIINFVWSSGVINTMNSPEYINYCVEDDECYELIELLKNKFIFSQWMLLFVIVIYILWIVIQLGFEKYIPESFNKYKKNIIELLFILHISITNNYILFSEQLQEIKPTWIFPIGLYNLSFIIIITVVVEIFSLIIICTTFIFFIREIYKNSEKIKFEIIEDKQLIVDKLV